MPLFGRRSRSVSVVRPTTPSNNSPAMMAASQAFLGQQTPPGKLATGAAAAALRSMSPASTPVGQIQTKRMAGRQPSVGGRVSDAPRGRSVGTLQRRGSAGSMSDRTFRAESPGRPSTSSGVPVTRAAEPPVPKLPDNLTNIPPIPPKSHRRSMSNDNIQVRKTMNNRNSVASSTASTPQRPINPASAAAKRVTSIQTSPSLDRNDGNGSHNFSYPGRARPQSPPPQKQSFEGPSTPVSAGPTGISQTEARRIQNKVTQISETPVKKKKMNEGPLNEGSHLSTGTMGSRPIVTPLAPAPEPVQSSPIESGRGINNAKLTGEASHFPPSPVSPTDSRGSDSDGERTQRRAKRASGALIKQPSIVREDWEGEQVDSPSSPVELSTSKRSVPPEANVSRKIESTPVTENLSTPKPRNQSLSPSRSARFSNRLSADMTDGQKHEPPARSISPRKSALKNSPHMLPLETGRQRDSSQTPSEATDVSLEGTRKKKTAHVKFDANPAVVGIAADSASPVSPQIASPQKKSGKKWFQKTSRVRLDEDSDDEDSMQPRPELPTFGSVRGGRKGQENSPSSVTQNTLSRSSSSSSIDTVPTTMNTSISSDNALGGLIAKDVEAKKQSLSPIPPEVTTVEGSGLHSDTESVYSQDDRAAIVPKSTIHAQTTVEAPVTAKQSGEAFVPGIAVLPPTPGTEEENKDQWLVDLPGGFPGQESTAEQDYVRRPSYETHEPPMPAIQEESDRDSIYSDAAEEQSDIEGDGFGSINAIVHSPISPVAASTTDSPIAVPQRDIHSDLMKSDWADTSARWRDTRDAVQKASLEPAATFNDKPREQAKQRTSQQLPTDSPASTISTNFTPVATPTPALTNDRQAGHKKTMRGASAEPVAERRISSEQKPLKSSLRSSTPTNQPALKSSLRSTSSPANQRQPAPIIGQAAVRQAIQPKPTAAAASATRDPRGALQKKNLRQSAPPPARQPLPSVADDSESDSSFRRRRRNRKAGPHSMRSSMRAAPEAAPAPARRDVRSMSPVQRRPFSPVGSDAGIRTTLRGSREEVPTMRGNQQGKRSSSLFGRSKALSPTRGGLSGPKSKFAADSDDEDKGPGRYKSRFADSSDEEDLRPVRGIPRRGGNDDSTDLEDSSDEERRRPKKEVAIAAPSPPPERPMSPNSEAKRRKGLFGMFKKKDESRPTSPLPQPSPRVVSQPKKQQSPDTAALMELARRKLEAEGAVTQSAQSPVPSPSARPQSPAGKLQRRMTPNRVMSDSWPLPPKIPDDNINDTRPVTSDGPVIRPSMGERQISSGTAATSPIDGRTTKKKRFPMLRKAFGLKD